MCHTVLTIFSPNMARKKPFGEWVQTGNSHGLLKHLLLHSWHLITRYQWHREASLKEHFVPKIESLNYFNTVRMQSNSRKFFDYVPNVAERKGCDSEDEILHLVLHKLRYCKVFFNSWMLKTFSCTFRGDTHEITSCYDALATFLYLGKYHENIWNCL